MISLFFDFNQMECFFIVIPGPHRYRCLHDFKQETAAVYDRTAVGIGAFVAAILQELIG
jgi:hypothetical protein